MVFSCRLQLEEMAHEYAPGFFSNLCPVTALAGFLLAVLPAAADDVVRVQSRPGDDTGFDPRIINGLVSSAFPAVGERDAGPSAGPTAMQRN